MERMKFNLLRKWKKLSNRGKKKLRFHTSSRTKITVDIILSLRDAVNKLLLFAYKAKDQSRWNKKSVSVISTNKRNWLKQQLRDIKFPHICLHIALDRAKSEIKCEGMGDSLCFWEPAGATAALGPSVSTVCAWWVLSGPGLPFLLSLPSRPAWLCVKSARAYAEGMCTEGIQPRRWRSGQGGMEDSTPLEW